jgi:hypothetical protein
MSLLVMGLVSWTLTPGDRISISLFGLTGMLANIIDILFYVAVFYAAVVGIFVFYTYNEKEFVIHYVPFTRRVAIDTVIFLTPLYFSFVYALGFKVKGQERMYALLTVGAKKKVKEFAAFLRHQNPSCVISEDILPIEVKAEEGI